MTHPGSAASTTWEGRRPPLAVWPCGPLPGDRTPPAPGMVTTELARRLIIEYTRPGGTVIDLTGAAHSAVTTQAGLLARRALGSERDSDSNGPASSPAASPTTPQGRPCPGPTDQGADLAVAAVDTDSQGAASYPGGSAAAVEQGQAVAALLGQAAHALEPGGIIAVVTGMGRTRRGLADPAPHVVRTASCMGLVYIQHVIAITAPICGSELVEPIEASGLGSSGQEEGLPVSVAQAAATVTRPVHLNVTVFRLPHRWRTATADTTGEVAV